ncbi:hypothetical protein Zm00014a_015673 [Zea mays]|uniref:Uncharacterized protein n=1 Tax=Zea mays TaxID=4577 RepID=A0A317YGJ0_MAIZE|nr:hypothetical protein Zm00014a_015673 [Zea mays]
MIEGLVFRIIICPDYITYLILN